MRISVDYGDGKKREVEVFPVILGNGKMVYRSFYHTNPVSRKMCYVEYDPDEKKVVVKEVE